MGEFRHVTKYSNFGAAPCGYAAAMIVSSSASAKLVERYGTKRIATVGIDTGYGRLAIAFTLMGTGTGTGLAGALIAWLHLPADDPRPV